VGTVRESAYRRSKRIGLALVTVVAAVAIVVALRPSTGEGSGCRPSLESPRGAYAHLAVVDDEGYVLPFSRLNLDDGAVWELEINDERSGVRRVRDRSLIKRLQSQRFECTGTDMATPDMGLSVYRDGALVYRTDIVKGEGLQNPELGFARAKNRLRFASLLW
jgi:hypothetical protein